MFFLWSEGLAAMKPSTRSCETWTHEKRINLHPASVADREKARMQRRIFWKTQALRRTEEQEERRA